MDNYKHLYEKSELIIRHLRGTLNMEEQEALEIWLNEDERNKALFNRLTNETQVSLELSFYGLSDKAAAKAKLLTAIGEQKTESKTVKLWPGSWLGYSISVAALAAIVFGVWLYYVPRQAEIISTSTLAHDVAPGKNTAVLTLANGKTINLSDSKSGIVIHADKLTYNDGTDLGVRETATLTAATPRGGQYQVSLPDGTKVWLNAASSLKFPATFTSLKERRVVLSGEAYFEVAKVYLSAKTAGAVVKRVPFIVETDRQQVEVLGTHFNVSNYADERDVKTTLLEGSVRVMDASEVKADGGIVLKPEQQSTLGADHQIAVGQVNGADVVAWKDGNFVFRAESLEQIMRKVARWYDVEIVYAADAPRMTPLSGVVSRSRNISVVLERIEATGSVKFRIEGKKIYVSK